MLKKLVILGIVGFVAVSALKGSKIGSFLRSEYEGWRERAESNIPPEREIARLRNEIKQLDKDTMAVVNQVAKERVEVVQLREKTDELRGKQSKDKEILTSRAAAIKAATEQVTFGNRTLSIAEAKAELEEGVRRYTLNQKSLEGLELALASREKVKTNLEKQLEAMRNQKAELTAAVDALEAEVQALKLQQMESKYQTDETRLAKIKEDIAGLKKRLLIEREKLNLMPAALEPAAARPAVTKSVEDIIAPLAAPQGNGAAPKVPASE